MTPIFTILIPHKNRPLLLARAIHSVPKRDDVQIIVVDDNSDPDIVDFDHFPCIDEPNVEVYFTKEGKGAGYARNVGLPHVKGKWLTIIGSDDYFTDAMPALMDKVADRQEDVIFFECTAINEPSMTPSERGDYISEQVEEAIATGDFSEVLLQMQDTCKFYRMDFVRKHNLHFHEVRWANDVWFVANASYYAEIYTAFPHKAYCITESDDSLVKHNSLESLLVRLKETNMAKHILLKRYKSEDMLVWQMEIWKKVWHKSKITGLSTIPSVIRYMGVGMCKYYLRFFSHLFKNYFKK